MFETFHSYDNYLIAFIITHAYLTQSIARTIILKLKVLETNIYINLLPYLLGHPCHLGYHLHRHHPTGAEKGWVAGNWLITHKQNGTTILYQKKKNPLQVHAHLLYCSNINKGLCSLWQSALAVNIMEVYVLRNLLFHWVLLCNCTCTCKACYVTHWSACSTRCSCRARVSLWSLD